MDIWTLDGNILLWIQDNIRNEFLTFFFTRITHLGDAGIFWILMSVALLFPKKTRLVGLAGVFALLFSGIVNNLILKPLVARSRPYEVIEELKLLIEKQKDYSFPSGHTGASFATATCFFRTMKKKYGIAFLVLASIIALSRLYVGVHYPTDVLGGLISGLLCGYFAVPAMQKYLLLFETEKKRFQNRKNRENSKNAMEK